MLGNYGVATQLVVSRVVLSSTEWVSDLVIVGLWSNRTKSVWLDLRNGKCWKPEKNDGLWRCSRTLHSSYRRALRGDVCKGQMSLLGCRASSRKGRRPCSDLSCHAVDGKPGIGQNLSSFTYRRQAESVQNFCFPAFRFQILIMW
jgi:hypothetical protein